MVALVVSRLFLSLILTGRGTCGFTTPTRSSRTTGPRSHQAAQPWNSLDASQTNSYPCRMENANLSSRARYTKLHESSSTHGTQELVFGDERSDGNGASSTDEDSSHGATIDTTFTFSPYSQLMQLQPGECETSPVLQLQSANDDCKSWSFCVKLYPRGGAHSSARGGSSMFGGQTRQRSGFGMSYKVLPWFGRDDDKVAVYLQYLPPPGRSTRDSVDASFALRLLGQQTRGPKFDVEFRSGMRFVPPSESTLQEGRANDFGAHLMQTSRLVDFLGIGEGDDHGVTDPSLQVRVSIRIHRPPPDLVDMPSLPRSVLLSTLQPRDIRGPEPERSQRHDTEAVRVGRIVVPVLSRLSQRPRLFEMGAYPGVEYRIMGIIDPATGDDVFYSRPGADYELKPVYPLVSQLERPWPVRVPEGALPKLYTPAMYNAISAVASLATAVTGLLAAFLVSQAVSLFVIPSHSMDPTLQVGDVLLVDKVTPRLRSVREGDVVLFHPPPRLREIVSQTGGRLGDRDLFVKRVAAVAGETLTVGANGDVLRDGRPDGGNRRLCDGPGVEAYLHTGDLVVDKHEVAVLGDCGLVSIDSRVWGTLPTRNIVGRPVVRLWPLSRFGSLPTLPPIE